MDEVAWKSCAREAWLLVAAGAVLLVLVGWVGANRSEPSELEIACWAMLFSVGVTLLLQVCVKTSSVLYTQGFRWRIFFPFTAAHLALHGLVGFLGWNSYLPAGRILDRDTRSEAMGYFKLVLLREYMWDIGLLYWIPIGMLLGHACLFSVKQYLRKLRPDWSWRRGLIRYGAPVGVMAFLCIALPGYLIFSMIFVLGPKQGRCLAALPSSVQDFIHENYSRKTLYEKLVNEGWLSEDRLEALSLGHKAYEKWERLGKWEYEYAYPSFKALKARNPSRAFAVACKIGWGQHELRPYDYVHFEAGEVVRKHDDKELMHRFLMPENLPNRSFVSGLLYYRNHEDKLEFGPDTERLILHPNPHFHFFGSAYAGSAFADFREKVLQSPYPEVRRRVLWFGPFVEDSNPKVTEWFIQQLRELDPVIRAETIAQHIWDAPAFSEKAERVLITMVESDPDLTVRRLATEYFGGPQDGIPRIAFNPKSGGYSYEPSDIPETEKERALRHEILLKAQKDLEKP